MPKRSGQPPIEPISNASTPHTEQTFAGKLSADWSGKKPLMAFGVVSGVMLLLVGAVAIGDRSNSSKERSQTACQNAVTNQLASPASADFSRVVALEEDEENAWRVTGLVDSQNRLGATIRSSFTCTAVDGNVVSVSVS